jgi:predicted nuclease with TOPRIM domain
MTIRNDMQIELDELRTNNSRLNSTVQELRLEIAYYQGETKRLEWEKSLLKQDVGKMSALFKGWLNELQNSNARSVLDDSDYFANLVKNPSKNISDILQLNNAKLLVTTCQAPFYIEVIIVILLRINVWYFRLYFYTQIL